MNRLAEYCMLAHGWRRALLLATAGGLAALSMPPLFVLPALFIGLPVWIWCLDGAERSHGWGIFFGPAFSVGFFFGVGYFLVALHWVGAAFFVDGGWLLLAMPFALLALAAVLALFWGLSSALAHLFWTNDAWRIVTFATLLTIGEFARGHFLSGFPFDLLGLSLTANEQMMQLVAFVGIYGLTALAALLGAMPALIWPIDGRALTRRLVPVFFVVLVLAAQLGFGQYRLDTIQLTPRQDIKLRLVQPTINQADKWQAENREFIMERLLALSAIQPTPSSPGLDAISHLIWPESAMPFYLADHPEELARIARMLPLGKFLITGAPRQEFGLDASDAAFNSILAINSDGEVVTSYDKTHLLPIGEFLPFRDFFRRIGFTQFVPGAEGWTHGDSRRLFAAPGIPSLLPLICYEAVFSADLGEAVEQAEFILNLTNDGWFDGSIGPAQHFHHVRLRAVEEGKPLVRVANTGITALIDPLGRIVAAIQPGAEAVLDVSPSQPIAMPFFAKYRHWPLLGLLVFLALIIMTRHRGHRG